MYQMYVVLGDGSRDGHSMSEKVLLHVSHTVEDIRDAYKQSCQKLGFSFNHNQNFTGIEHSEPEKYRVCCDYDDTILSEEIIEILDDKGFDFEEAGFDLDDGEVYVDSDNYIMLLMWFIGYSLDDFDWATNGIDDRIPTLNVGSLNVQFGYGLFSH